MNRQQRAGLAGFSDVDHAPDPASFTSALAHLDRLSFLAKVRKVGHTALEGITGPGIDVGCGRGTVVADLVRRGLDARGVDRSHTMIEAARTEHPGCEFAVGDAYSLPCEDGTLAWYRAERVYIHLDDPAAAVAEARRALVPGGLIVLVEPDMEAMTVDTDHPHLVRAALTALADDFAHGRAGTKARTLLIDAGYTDITVTPVTEASPDPAEFGPIFPGLALDTALRTGALHPDDVDRLRHDLDQRVAEGRYQVSSTFFITAGHAPRP